MKKQKASSIVLALLLAVSACTACAGETQPESKETATEPVTQVETETETTRYAAELPARDFEGEAFTFYARIYSGTWDAKDLLAEGITGEKINDALYERQTYLEDTYNLSLHVVPSGNDDILASVKTFVNAGDDTYQAIIGKVYNMASLTLSGMLMDLHEVDNIDLTKPWWGQVMNDSVSVGGKQHYAVGDLFINDNQSERIYYFNKGLAEQLGIGNLYETVREGKWTIDTFMKCNEAALADLNGDGKYTRDADRFGTMAQPQHLGFGLYLGAGQMVIGKDENDLPYFQAAQPDAIDIMVTIAEKIGGNPSISNSGDAVLSPLYPDNLVYFTDGRVLFSPEVLIHIETMRDSDVDIGILPVPKFTEAQENYYCYADGHCVNAIGVPVTNLESEKIGFVLEAMAAESKNNLTPAYFEVCLTDKYVRDPDSAEMLSLVMESAVLDLGEIYQWNGITSTVSEAINNGSAIASTITAKESAVNKSMEKTVKAILGGE